LADVAKEANARLFELSQGAEGLADALKSLLLNPDALMNARRASLSMSARFDLKHSLDQYGQILRRSATRK
jgi:hypothetical protein